MIKNRKVEITVLTTTYNRVALLPRLFDSLQKQTLKDFEWLVIDDGSTDETSEYISTLKPNGFSVKYYKKENGGKHTALNAAHKYIDGKYILILDSDDYLVPNAVEIIVGDIKKYANDSNIGVLCYEKGFSDGTVVSERLNVTDYYISDYISFDVNQGVKGDQCEVVKTNILKQFVFPIYDNEKFMSESWLWNNIAREYKTVYIHKVLYICEYLPGGLTKSGRRLRLNSPLGMMEVCKSFFNENVCWRIQFKEMLLYCIYGLYSKETMYSWIKNSNRTWMIIFILPLGFMIYGYWKLKYKE